MQLCCCIALLLLLCCYSCIVATNNELLLPLLLWEGKQVDGGEMGWRLGRREGDGEGVLRGQGGGAKN